VTVQEFAKQYRLKLVRDPDGGDFIAGRLYKDAVISEHDNGMLAMCFLVDGRAGAPSRQALFNRVKKESLDAGMRIAQEGDQEAVFVFDPEKPEQSKLAIRSIRAKVKRQLSPEQVARQVAVLAKARQEGSKITGGTHFLGLLAPKDSWVNCEDVPKFVSP
jgi:hypothetical protein